MRISQHAAQRMSQRGISRRLVELTLQYGRIEGDRRVLDRKESQRLIEDLTEQMRIAKRVLDKGGVTVVEQNGALITTYNTDQPVHRSPGER
jgi:hypothetical protein